jgi:hypothetical protein
LAMRLLARAALTSRLLLLLFRFAARSFAASRG